MTSDTKNKISLKYFHTAIADILKDSSPIHPHGIDQHQEFISIIKDIENSAIELSQNYTGKSELFWSDGDSLPIQNMLIKIATNCYQNDNIIGIQVINHLIAILPSQCSDHFKEISAKLIKTITNQPRNTDTASHEKSIGFIETELYSSKASSISGVLSYIAAKSRHSNNPTLNHGEIAATNSVIRELIAKFRRIQSSPVTETNHLRSKYDKFIHLAKFIQHNGKVNPKISEAEIQPLIDALLEDISSTEKNTIVRLERSLETIRVTILSNANISPENKQDKIKFAETLCDIASREVANASPQHIL
jgi:hypothetical protein